MPTVQIEADLSYDTLLQVAGQLSLRELEELEARLRELRARRQAPSLPSAESALLLRINEPPDATAEARYAELRARLIDGTLTSTEHQELVALSDAREEQWAQRLEAVAELARLRGVGLMEMMQELGLPGPKGEPEVV